MAIMNTSSDIRWKQRFSNYKKALDQLLYFFEHENLNIMEKQGLIKAFEYTYELAWKTIKDFLEFQGKEEIIGSRDAFREAFKDGIVDNGESWMQMIEVRNRTSHTFDLQITEEITEIIKKEYCSQFVALEKKLAKYDNQ